MELNLKITGLPLPIYLAFSAVVVGLWEWLVWFSSHAPTGTLVYEWDGTVSFAKVLASIAAIGLIYLARDKFVLNHSGSETFWPSLALFTLTLVLIWRRSTYQDPTLMLDFDHSGEMDLSSVVHTFGNTVAWLIAFGSVIVAAGWAALKR
jgi:hypothetical protein